LDGWRAISILFVLGAHCTITEGFPARFTNAFNWIFDGSLGVRFFFVISGFLITWLLLVEEQRSGRVDLRHFYIRRALRILPVYTAFLAVLLGLQIFTAFHLDARSWIGSLTFSTNIVGTSSWTNGHLWSLAQEEQFYLVWPGLFVLSGASARPRTAACLLSIPILACPLIRVLGYLRIMPPLFYHCMGTSSFDSIAFGCAAAVLFNHKRAEAERCISSAPRQMVFAGTCLILFPYILTKIFLAGILTVPLGESLQAVGFCVLLLVGIVKPNFVFFRVLCRRWMCEIGLLSYSIYIWQQIFCSKPGAFGLEHAWWLAFPSWLVPVFLTAFLSYYALEQPLFRLRKHFRD